MECWLHELPALYHRTEVELLEDLLLKAFSELLTQKKVHNFFFYHQDFSLTSFSFPRYNISDVKLDRNMEYCPKVGASDEIPSSTFFSPEICRLD